jgi:hypothetical protein
MQSNDIGQIGHHYAENLKISSGVDLQSCIKSFRKKQNGGDVNKTRSSMFLFSLHHFTSYILPQYFVKHPLAFITAWILRGVLW